MEDLYSSILQGRLDLRLPLANARAPDRAVLVSRLVAMPVKQHMQLQVMFTPRLVHRRTKLLALAGIQMVGTDAACSWNTFCIIQA